MSYIAVVPKMTSNTAPEGYTVTASDETYGKAYWAFSQYVPVGTSADYSGPNLWEPAAKNGWITIQLPAPQIITQYSMSHTNYADWVNRYPKTFSFEAWDGNNWIILDTQTAAPAFSQSGDIHYFPFKNTVAYAKYRLNISANAGGDYLALFDFQLYRSKQPPQGGSGGM